MENELDLSRVMPTHSAWALRIKRGMDLLISVCGLLLLSPLFLIIAVGIRLDTVGPIFFRQIRVGLGGQMFWMLKFRSMYAGADQQGLDELASGSPKERLSVQQLQKLVNDPRRTRFGRFLRRTSLDELPQLWNVLTGEMSLVGPRPFLPHQQKFYGAEYRNYIRFRPGLSGMWQVSGRNLLSFQERVELDAIYFQNWSIKLDVEILRRTVGVVLKGEGAL